MKQIRWFIIYICFIFFLNAKEYSSLDFLIYSFCGFIRLDGHANPNIEQNLWVI